MEQTWDNGGTSHVLPEERKRATFSVAKMMGILDGGKKATFQRQWIQGAHDDALDGKNHPEVEVHAEVSREESIKNALKHFMDVHRFLLLQSFF